MFQSWYRCDVMWRGADCSTCLSYVADSSANMLRVTVACLQRRPNILPQLSALRGTITKMSKKAPSRPPKDSNFSKEVQEARMGQNLEKISTSEGTRVLTIYVDPDNHTFAWKRKVLRIFQAGCCSCTCLIVPPNKGPSYREFILRTLSVNILLSSRSAAPPSWI